MAGQRQGKSDFRQRRQLIQQHTHQPRFLTVTLRILHRQQTKTLDQLPGQRCHFQHPTTPIGPLAILATHVQAAHLGAHRCDDLMIKIRRNPDPPLRRREETAFGGVHAENAADGVGKLHPVMAMGRRPRTCIEALHPGVQRAR
ncbi:hypothetical protein D3C87_1628520 [compost metagenome]